MESDSEDGYDEPQSFDESGSSQSEFDPSDAEEDIETSDEELLLTATLNASRQETAANGASSSRQSISNSNSRANKVAHALERRLSRTKNDAIELSMSESESEPLSKKSKSKKSTPRNLPQTWGRAAKVSKAKEMSELASKLGHRPTLVRIAFLYTLLTDTLYEG